LVSNENKNSTWCLCCFPQAQQGHDVICNTLLEQGADVTLVDDTGLTPLDAAKNKKVKATLKAAWTDSMQRKISSQLAPVELRRSGSFTQGQLHGQNQCQGQQQQQQQAKRTSTEELHDVGSA